MNMASCVFGFLARPSDILTWVQFLFFYHPRRNIASDKEHPTSGWDRVQMRRCWALLDQTSHNFAGVIKQLDGELARTVCLFYLILRSLHTIEGDRGIPDALKLQLLRSFHNQTFSIGWTFSINDCGSVEKGQQLLVEYDTIVSEVLLLYPTYRAIFTDIVEKMATKMADNAARSACTVQQNYIVTVADYDIYCHYTAGLIGEGLSRIFSASRHEARWLEDQLELSNAMGLLLQKSSIIRHVRKDIDAEQYFWPREIWESYGFTSMEGLCDQTAREKAMWTQSAMIVDALRHTIDALKYLQLLTNQSVFNFCAIPAVMALANLHMCFMNSDMFNGHLELRKTEVIGLMMRATTMNNVALIFSQYAHKIHAKCVPSDPNHLLISTRCGKIQRWQEQYYPSNSHTPHGEYNVKDHSQRTLYERPWLQKETAQLSAENRNHIRQLLLS